MATKTILCPECQAPAASGRYACTECGALLASVGVATRPDARSNVSIVAGNGSLSALAVDASDGNDIDVAPHASPAQPAPAWTHALAADPDAFGPVASVPGEDERWDDEQAPITDASEMASPDGDAGDVGALDHASPAPIASRTPTTVAVKGASTPKIAPTRPKPTRANRTAPKADAAALARIATRVDKTPVIEPTIAAAEPAILSEAPPTALEDSAPAVAEPLLAPEPAQEIVGSASLPDADVVPGWPPPGNIGIVEPPAPRVPAGLYLPPSAVLPSGEALASAGAATGGAVHAGATPDHAAFVRISSAARLAELGLPADMPRRVVGIGAFVVTLGFLLPWAAVGPGTALLDYYWVIWGLAGPGHWIVVAILIALAGLTVSSGRLARVPVGLAAIALATLLLGLSWSSLFGYSSRAVGIWVVLAGAILLAAGGLLDLRASRHDDGHPSV